MSERSHSTRFFGALTIGSGLLFAGGAYNLYEYDKILRPVAIECSKLTTDVSLSEDILIKDGVIAFPSRTLLSEGSAEIRKPNDQRIERWGDLKNRRDNVCRGVTTESNAIFGWDVAMLLVGGFGAVIFWGKILSGRRSSRLTPSSTA